MAKAIEAIFLAALAGGGPAPTAGEQACVKAKEGVRAGDEITVAAGTGAIRAVAEEAIAHWRAACGSDYGASFPSIRLVGPEENATYRIALHRRSPAGPRCGMLRGRTIETYLFATDENGRVSYCGPPSLVLAHELGHALGLADAPGERCAPFIMASIDRASRYRRRVRAPECAAVAQRWVGFAEPAIAPSQLRAHADSQQQVAGEKEGSGEGRSRERLTADLTARLLH